jgi:biotin carboxyl carrier protein
MKLNVDVDGTNHVFETRANGATTEYTLDGGTPGSASIEEVRPGVFSVLLGTRSFTVNVAPRDDAYEVVSSDGRAHTMAISDARDRGGSGDTAGAKGPATIRAHMPGKIIKLLVEVGVEVEAGQGLIVVEAMKMQNEVKAPKNGVVMKVLIAAGATVAAGETLIVLE